MAQILITAGIFFMIIVSLFLILVVLMQRANSDGGLGAAFGGGITESAFGTEAGNIMTKITKYSFVIFFITGFILYLAILSQHSHKATAAQTLFDEEAAAEAKKATATQTATAPVTTVPAAQAPATQAPAKNTAPSAPATPANGSK